MARPADDLIGNTYHRLTPFKRDGSDKHGRAYWLCKCSCKDETIKRVTGNNLKMGLVTSCGCSHIKPIFRRL